MGRYRLIEILGAGASGQVYRARDPKLDRDVALKVLAPTSRLEERAEAVRARLSREAQAIAALSHPNIVAVYDVANSEEGLFIARSLHARGDDPQRAIAQATMARDALARLPGAEVSAGEVTAWLASLDGRAAAE